MDLSGSPLGCARWIPPAVACFRGALCLVEDERLRKCAISDGSATEHALAQQNLNLASIATMVGTDAPTLSLLFQHRRKHMLWPVQLVVLLDNAYLHNPIVVTERKYSHPTYLY